jgi:hypothetical protein
MKEKRVVEPPHARSIRRPVFARALILATLSFEEKP